MTYDKFNELWKIWSEEWYCNARCNVADSQISVTEFCTINKDCTKGMWQDYEKEKRRIKELYFYDTGTTLNKYKRAALLAYTVNSAAPLEYNQAAYNKYFENSPTNIPDRLFLKQRLAFFVALGSIIVEYDQAQVRTLSTPLFHFPALSQEENNLSHTVDSFLIGVYKDLFYSDIYHNRNVLTLANVFWLLTDSSELSSIQPLPANTVEMK